MISSLDHYERIVPLNDRKSGLKGYIVIHNTSLGPATGGTRMMPYTSEQDALDDALRLSKAMTYKCALAGVPYGGGKAILIGDPKKDETEGLLTSYARVLNTLNGIFTTGEDVGIAREDVRIMARESPYVNGTTSFTDPSPFAALSVFYAIQTACQIIFKESLANKKVAVKGMGKVGLALIRFLIKAGAKIYVADIDPVVCSKTPHAFPGVTIVEPDQIHRLLVDVFAPCALGNEITEKNVSEINAKLVCGSANNQLSSHEAGDLLFQRGILYVPDYLADAGGLINVIDEREPGGYQRLRVMERIHHLSQTVRKVMEQSIQSKTPPNRIADRMAEEIISRATSSALRF